MGELIRVPEFEARRAIMRGRRKVTVLTVALALTVAAIVGVRTWHERIVAAQHLSSP